MPDLSQSIRPAGVMRCAKCGEQFSYKEEDCWWDYKGMNYDAKLVKCTYCNTINIVKYIEHPNRDEWYYEYKEK